MNRIRMCFAALLSIWGICLGSLFAGGEGLEHFPVSHRIQPSAEYPGFWSYKGAPLLLAGGSKDDNLFQIPDLVEHLEEMRSVGGNYVRNTMSDRRDRGHEVYPFQQLRGGKYDLEQWNPEYWSRFERLLRETYARDIIVQIEVWDRFDYSRDHWEIHPYNPKNNVNYSFAGSGLQEHYPKHPGANEQPFFFTTPGQQNNRVVFQYQERFVRELLRISLEYPNVLYCIDNETSGAEEWGSFWAGFIAAEAELRGVPVFVTEMWDDWDLRAEEHRRTFDHPERYQFVDVSQNNHQVGEKHWEGFAWVRGYLGRQPRPINTVKTYGADGGRYGTTRDGVERWWRHLIGGAAAVRFHRPDSGIGLSGTASAALRALRLSESRVNYWELSPRMEWLLNREENEAYLTADGGSAYVVYFPSGGDVKLDTHATGRERRVEWISIDRGEWGPRAVEKASIIRLAPPDDGQWLAIVTAPSHTE